MNGKALRQSNRKPTPGKPDRYARIRTLTISQREETTLSILRLAEGSAKVIAEGLNVAANHMEHKPVIEGILRAAAHDAATLRWKLYAHIATLTRR